MNEVIAWVTAQRRFPKTKAADQRERSIAHWLSRRWREAAADEARWHHRLT